MQGPPGLVEDHVVDDAAGQGHAEVVRRVMGALVVAEVRLVRVEEGVPPLITEGGGGGAAAPGEDGDGGE